MGPATPTPRLSIGPLDDSNREAVIALAGPTWDRPATAEYLAWRYRDCPAQEAIIAMADGACVATMFAFRRQYTSPGGDRECLEPFDWHTTEEWRARGAGLRVVKKYMQGTRPIIALGGTDAARALFRRLGWTELTTALRLDLPRRGAYYVARGRSAVFARVFDLLGPLYFSARRRRAEMGLLEPTSELSGEIVRIARAQRRFALLRLPDPETQRWLDRAPAAAGSYLKYHVRIDGQLAGWATARVYPAVGMRIASIQEVFLADDHRAAYPAVLRGLVALLDGHAPDAISCVTSCPDVTAALRTMRFRVGDIQSVFTWWPGGAPPEGAVLVDGSHAEWLAFPIATASEAARLSPSGT